jgi:Domain of unknown function (DUF5667)
VSMRGSDQQLLDELDALLDGRPTKVDEELGPLVQAAGELRSALLEIELDPEVAEQHLAQVLDGSVATVVPLPTQRLDLGWRRRLVVAALAAALTVFPAAAASAASGGSLPGQSLYPVKLAVEQLRVASVAWSSTREAGVRTGIAGTRLVELDGLVHIGDTERIPPAIRALDKAVAAAEDACMEAMTEDGTSKQVEEVAKKLVAVQSQSVTKVATIVARLPSLPAATRQAITVAIAQSPTLKGTPATGQPPVMPGGGGAPNTTGNPPPATPPVVASTSPPATSPPTTAAPPPPSTTEPPTTTTTEPPPTTAAGGSGGSGQGQTKGGNGKDPTGATAPPTT